MFSHGGYCIFGLCALLRVAEKKRVAGLTSDESEARRRSEKQAREEQGKAQNLRPKLTNSCWILVRKRSRKELRAQTCLQERVGKHFGTVLALFEQIWGPFLASESEPKRAHILERISEHFEAKCRGQGGVPGGMRAARKRLSWRI